MDILESLQDWQDYEPAKVFCPEMMKDIVAAITEIKRLRAALTATEEWWLSEGMKHFDGAPYAMFAVRAALRNEQNEIDNGR